MAIVNKFNVNREQVTLDADIIENMSANDVSYNSSLQYDENTVGDKLSELESKSTEFEQQTNTKIAELEEEIYYSEQSLVKEGTLEQRVIFKNTGIIGQASSALYKLDYYPVQAGDKITYDIRQSLSVSFAVLAFSQELPNEFVETTVLEVGADAATTYSNKIIIKQDGYLIHCNRQTELVNINKIIIDKNTSVVKDVKESVDKLKGEMFGIENAVYIKKVVEELPTNSWKNLDSPIPAGTITNITYNGGEFDNLFVIDAQNTTIAITPNKLPFVTEYDIVSIYGWAGQWCIYYDKENVPVRLGLAEDKLKNLEDVSGSYESDNNLLYSINDVNGKTLFAITNNGEVVALKFDKYTRNNIANIVNSLVGNKSVDFLKMVNYSIPGMTVEMAKEIIDTMGSVNLNIFQFPLHNVILDDMTFHANGRVYDFSNIEMDAPITQNQFEELVNYARDRGVEILCDSIRVLTHANRLLDLFPELRYGNSHYDLNFSDKEAINVALAYAEKYASFAASIGCRYFHLDGDEFGIVPSHNRPYPEGYKYLHDRGEYDYMYLINKLSFMLKKYNMYSLVWNDPVCVNGVNYPKLSDDIIVDYWENGNGMGGSPIGTKIIEDNGYKMINSKQELYWTYAERGPKTTLDVIANYNPYKMAGGLICKNVIGCKMNVWGDGATASDARYILDTTLPLVKAYGNRLLNLDL